MFKRRTSRRVTIFLFAVIYLFTAMVPSFVSAESTMKASKEVKSYLVGFKANTDLPKYLAKKSINSKVAKKFKYSKAIVLNLSRDEIQSLESDSSVSFIELDATASVAPVGSVDKNNSTATKMKKDSQTIPWGIHSIGADLLTKDIKQGNNIKIAVLDTGISDHSDIKVKGGVSFVDYTSSYKDDNGHGTHVAGTIAAADNKQGIIGVAPNADIYAVKILNKDGDGSYSQIIQGIEWAIDNKIDIINMSFGGVEYSEALRSIIEEAYAQGILLIAAAGNNGFGEETELYPARYPEVVSVGAVNQIHARAEYSGTGNELDIMAPGTSILSTTIENKYGIMSGTSMAVPHITGAAAVLWSTNKKWTSKDVINKLYDTATPIGDIHDTGHGLVNLAKAFGMIDSPILPDETNVPSEIYVPEKVENIDSFNLSKVDKVLNAQYVKLNNLLELAKSSGNIIIVKELEQKVNELYIENRHIHSLPENLRSLDKEQRNNPATSLAIDSYYAANANRFRDLADAYQSAINNISEMLGLQQECISKQESWEPNDTPDTAHNISVGEVLEAYIDRPWSMEGPGDMDVYTYIADISGTTSIEIITPSDLNYELVVLDSNLDYITSARGRIGIISNTSTQAGVSEGDMIEENNSFSVKKANFSVIENEKYYFLIHGRSPSDYSESRPYLLKTNSITPEITVPNEPLPIYLDSPIDVDLPIGKSQIFEFTPNVTGKYTIVTSVYEQHSYSNDTYLELYSDAALTEMITYSDNYGIDRFSRIVTELIGGKTYYIKLRPEFTYEKVHARIAINIAPSYPILSLDSPIDVELPIGKSQLYEFTPNATGSYVIATSPYAETGDPNDTYLELYPDDTGYNMITSDDDSNGSMFSKISNVYLIGNTTYYVRLRPYNTSSGKVYARLSASIDPNAYPVLDMNKPIDIDLPVGMSKVFQIIPDLTGVYNITTSPKSGIGDTNDTYLEVYNDAALTQLISYDDNSNGNGFSKISITLDRQKNYYVRLRPYDVSTGQVSTRIEYNITPPYPILRLNSPIDLDLPVGASIVYQFTPTIAETYDIFTKLSTEIGSSDDIYMELSDDPDIRYLKAMSYHVDGDSIAKICSNLDADTTYFIRLSPVDRRVGKVQARLEVNVTTDKYPIINLNSYIDVDLPVGEGCTYRFTPSVTDKYIVSRGSYKNEVVTDNSTLPQVEVFSDAALRYTVDPDTICSDTYNLVGNKTYYIKLSPNFATSGKIRTRLAISTDNNDIPVLEVNSPIDVDLPYGVSQFYRFTPRVTGYYYIATSPYAEVGSANDTCLELYRDSAQAHIMMSSNGHYTNGSPYREGFSILGNTLEANETYYIRLSPYDATAGRVHARLTIQTYTPAYPTYDLDSESFCDNPAGFSWLHQLIPSTTGTYIIATSPNSYAMGVDNSNDTFLELFNDAALTDLIVSDDNSNGNGFAMITVNLSAGEAYYLKFRHNDPVNGAINARLKIKEVTPIALNSPMDVQVARYQDKLFSFTPDTSGTYSIYTSSYENSGIASDTALKLYTGPDCLNNLIAYDDDSGQDDFSKILYNLTGGKTYYIAFTGYGDVNISGRLTIEGAESPVTVDSTAITDKTNSEANVSSSISVADYRAVRERGFVYATTTNPTILNNKIIAGSGSGIFSVNLTGLSSDTTYYIRAYAITNIGVTYGNETSFTTKSDSVVNIGYAMDGEEYLDDLVAELGATLNGNVVTYNGLSITFDDTNSRTINGRKLVNSYEFAEFFTSYDIICSRLMDLGGSIVVATIGANSNDGDNVSIMNTGLIKVAAYGEQSENVRNIQKVLQKEGCWFNPDGTVSNAPATGYFGNVTKKSIIEFQKRQNITVSSDLKGCNIQTADRLSVLYARHFGGLSSGEAAVENAKLDLEALGYGRQYPMRVNGELDGYGSRNFHYALLKFISDWGYTEAYQIGGRNRADAYSWLRHAAGDDALVGMSDEYVNSLSIDNLIYLIDENKKAWNEAEQSRILRGLPLQSDSQVISQINIDKLFDRLKYLEVTVGDPIAHTSYIEAGYLVNIETSGNWERYKYGHFERKINNKIRKIQNDQEQVAAVAINPYAFANTVINYDKITEDELNKLYKLKIAIAYAVDKGRNVFEDEITLDESLYRIDTNWGKVFDSRDLILKQLNGEYFEDFRKTTSLNAGTSGHDFNAKELELYFSTRQERYGTSGTEKLADFINTLGPAHDLAPYAQSPSELVEEGIQGLILVGTIVIAIEALPAILALGSASISYFSSSFANRWSILISNMGGSAYQYCASTGYATGLFINDLPLVAEAEYVGAIAATSKLTNYVMFADRFSAINGSGKFLNKTIVDRTPYPKWTKIDLQEFLDKNNLVQQGSETQPNGFKTVFYRDKTTGVIKYVGHPEQPYRDAARRLINNTFDPPHLHEYLGRDLQDQIITGGHHYWY